MRTQKAKKGFTLVEVIIAGAIFSFLLIVAIGALVNALTIYAGANISRDNQQSLRNITEEIGRRASFATNMAVDSGKLCIRSTTGDAALYYVDGNQQLRRISQSTSGRSCLEMLNADWHSPTGGDLISATSVQVKIWNPQIVTNPADPSQADTKTTLSVDLEIGVARPASDFIGLGTTPPTRLNNTFNMHVAFFALNN